MNDSRKRFASSLKRTNCSLSNVQVGLAVILMAIFTSVITANQPYFDAGDDTGKGSPAKTENSKSQPSKAQPSATQPLTESVAERYSQPSTEAPDFQRHVAPLLGRLGCNGRACHGSFQGAGGFQLSLFGFDFAKDHEQLLEDGAARVDLDDPDESLILTKPTSEDDHEGGLRYERGSWQFNLLKGWVENGAERDVDEMRLEKLTVTPSELILRNPKQQVQLKVVAHWADGTREDVTPLARFQTNDSQIADVTEAGVVSTNEFGGDTHVVVFYDNAVSPVPVLHPLNDQIGNRYGTAMAPTVVDQHVVTKLRKLGIKQSPVADDETFLRRVSIDITGTLPSPDEIRAFLADEDPGKRTRKVDELLESPAYAAWWATFLCDLTGNNSGQLRNLSLDQNALSRQWYEWIEKRVAENTPYDEIVEGIVLGGNKLPDESFDDFCVRMKDVNGDASGEKFAELDSMPYYWMRREYRDGEVRAISFAHAFLGIRIQCAQCHKHPFDEWTQHDFKQFSRFFTGVTTKTPNPKSDEVQQIYNDLGIDTEKLKGGKLQQALAKATKEGKVVPLPYLNVHKPTLSREELRRKQKEFKEARKKGNKKAKLQKHHTDAILLGESEVAFEDIEDVRKPVMKWLRRSDNPYFARALVNRVWAKYFGVGIVQPADDLNLANPPSNAELLDYLANGFVENGYDMKWLHREIATSRTYQLSWEVNATNQNDRRNFSRALPRRLPAEVVYDAVNQAASNKQKNRSYRENVEQRAISIPGTQMGRGKKQAVNPGFAMQVFGRSIRETNCDCDRSEETSLIQTIYLQNDRDIYSLMSQRDGWLAELRGLRSKSNLSEKDEKKLKEANRRIAQLKKVLDGLNKRGDKKRAAKIESQMIKMEDKIKPLREQRKKLADEKSNEIKPRDFITEAYLRTLSRRPTEDEVQRCLEFVNENEDALEGLKGVFWTLLNTKEFIVNH